MSDLQLTRLDSGLTVATERVPGTRSVATGVWVGVGARDEPAELGGVSHFLEHLVFKGTARRSALDISRTIDRVGGDINAFTSKEYTAYHCRLPERHAAVGIDLHGEVLTAPALRDDDVDTERQVILEELAMDDDSPDEVVQRVFAERAFPDHPLGRDTAGSRMTVDATDADAIRDFFRTRYTAGSMVVSVAGPGSHDEMLALVERAFAGLTPGDGRRPRSAPEAMAAGMAVHDDTEQVQIVIGGRAFDRADPDREALDVVNQALGGGLSSRLFEEIREQRGLVYSVFSGLALYSDSGTYSISAGTQPEHAAEVVALILAELDKLAEHGLSDDEIEIARGALTGSFEMGLEDTGSRMARTAALLCTRGEVIGIDEQMERWRRVDQAAVRRVIDRILADAPIVVTVGPVD